MKAQIKEIGEIVIAGRKYLEVIPEDKNVDLMSAWMNFFEDIKDNFDMKNYKDCFGLSENMKMIDGKVAMDYVICMRKEAGRRRARSMKKTAATRWSRCV